MLSVKFHVLVCLVFLSLTWDLLHADDCQEDEEKCERSCVGTNKKCFTGQCMCEPGYYHVHSTDSCVENCTELADTFTRYNSSMIQATGPAAINATVGDCENQCKRMGCLSFNLKDHSSTTKCFTFGFTARHTPHKWRYAIKSRWNHFQRDCKIPATPTP